MLAPDDKKPIYNYTLDCYHMVKPFTQEELEDSTLVGPFDYTNGYRILKVKKIKPKNQSSQLNLGTFLYDLKKDPQMNNPFRDEKVESEIKGKIIECMEENEIPEEVYERFGLDHDIKGEKR